MWGGVATCPQQCKMRIKRYIGIQVGILQKTSYLCRGKAEGCANVAPLPQNLVQPPPVEHEQKEGSKENRFFLEAFALPAETAACW